MFFVRSKVENSNVCLILCSFKVVGC